MAEMAEKTSQLILECSQRLAANELLTDEQNSQMKRLEAEERYVLYSSRDSSVRIERACRHGQDTLEQRKRQVGDVARHVGEADADVRRMNERYAVLLRKYQDTKKSLARQREQLDKAVAEAAKATYDGVGAAVVDLEIENRKLRAAIEENLQDLRRDSWESSGERTTLARLIYYHWGLHYKAVRALDKSFHDFEARQMQRKVDSLLRSQ